MLGTYKGAVVFVNIYQWNSVARKQKIKITQAKPPVKEQVKTVSVKTNVI